MECTETIDFEKKYKELIERLRPLYKQAKEDNSPIWSTYEYICPEIAISKEDEMFSKIERAIRGFYKYIDADEILKTLEEWRKELKNTKVKYNELTWKDINDIERIINNVHYEFNSIGEQSFGELVLERFMEEKDEVMVEASVQKSGLQETLEEYKISDKIANARIQGIIEGKNTVINNPEEFGLKNISEGDRPNMFPNEEQMLALKEVINESASSESAHINDWRYNILLSIYNEFNGKDELKAKGKYISDVIGSYYEDNGIKGIVAAVDADEKPILILPLDWPNMRMTWEQAMEYGNSLPSPWHIPSKEELERIWFIKGYPSIITKMINKGMREHGGKEVPMNTFSDFWSSSEYDSGTVFSVCTGTGCINFYDKDGHFLVCPVASLGF